MRVESNEVWLKSRQWPPARARWLKTEAMTIFQRSYRNYRKGNAKGAKGEVFDVGDSGIPMDEVTAIREISIFQDSEDPNIIRHAKLLEKYRQAYRQFRSGAAKGAEGEVCKLASGFTREQLRLLPVAALAHCLADQLRTKSPVAQSQFHCHIGAGKLGLGLVLPAMVASGAAFAIVQRPSDAWSSVINSPASSISLKINGVTLCSLQLIRSWDEFKATGVVQAEKDSWTIEAPLRGSVEAERCRWLVLDPEISKICLVAAESFSCSLGPAIKKSMEELAEVLSANSGLERPAIYACENDHKAVDGVRNLLDAPLFVKECMVDRICSDRVVTSDSIDVVAEPFEGEIVVTARYPSAISPAFAGDNVFMPDTSGAYSYLYQRKFLLVNGTHTTLAFMTLRTLCKDPADAPGDFELLNPDTIPAECKEELRAWAAARCLVLLHSNEVEVIKFAHNVKEDAQVVEGLWKYAERTMQRFSTVKDTTKRVLGGGVANRYETRLKDVLDTLETFDRSVPLAKLLLKCAGFQSMAQLKQVLRKLVADAEVFVMLPGSHPTAAQPRYVEGYQYLRR